MDFVTPLLGWLEAGYDIVTPYFFVRDYEGCVLLRKGKFKRVLTPGPHWKWPIIDETLTCSIATETISTKSQSLMTKDNISVFISGAVKCEVVSPELYLLKVKDVDNAISDLAQGAIKTEITSRTFDQCRTDDIDNEIAKRLRTQAKKWGVGIDSVIITTFDKGRTIRLIQS